jgi:hypothetical protein
MAGRSELLGWINSTLDLRLGKVEEVRRLCVYGRRSSSAAWSAGQQRTAAARVVAPWRRISRHTASPALKPR